ncbi:hypothetical protein OG21DRAFT_1483775 [Imleria badia]|nr:hypothetical protein OG21DRAFT_1483775 [Imleria badia]
MPKSGLTEKRTSPVKSKRHLTSLLPLSPPLESLVKVEMESNHTNGCDDPNIGAVALATMKNLSHVPSISMPYNTVRSEATSQSKKTHSGGEPVPVPATNPSGSVPVVPVRQPFRVQTLTRVHEDGISVTNNIVVEAPESPTKPAKNTRYIRITKMFYSALADCTVHSSTIDEIWKCINGVGSVYEPGNWAAILAKCGVPEDHIHMVIQIMRAANRETARAN